MDLNVASQLRSARLSLSARLLLGGASIVVLTLLAIAACLRPSERGFGTHQQLGLPACTSVALFGRRCPSCGMTTSWAWILDGDPWRACQANAGGALLAVLSLVLGPWCLLSAGCGRWLFGKPRDSLVLVVALAVAGVTLVDWGWRLATDPGGVLEPAPATMTRRAAE
jgi:hypothetical protein